MSTHPIYIILSSIEVMSRVSIALHLPAVHDNLTRQIVICNDNYKFATYTYSILQEFAVDNKVIVKSQFKTVR